jgi:hypothetical protein
VTGAERRDPSVLTDGSVAAPNLDGKGQKGDLPFWPEELGDWE